MIWSLVTFAGLLILLARFAFKPLKKILGEREAFIKDTLEKARQAQAEAEKALAETAAKDERGARSGSACSRQSDERSGRDDTQSPRAGPIRSAHND